MIIGRAILVVFAVGLGSPQAFPQGRPASTSSLQRGRPAPASSRPAYMQQLKSFEETQFVTKAVLKNGMTVLINEYRTLPVVAILTYVKAGGFNETDDAVGASHLLEHLLFKGTPTRSTATVGKDTRALGGFLSTSASYDSTSFSTIVPSAQWKKAFEIQSDALLNASLDEDQIKREIEAIRREDSQNLGNPDHLAYGKLLELGFATHRLRRGNFGGEQVLRGLNQEKLRDYYKTMYRPERVILVVSGDVSSSDALNEIVRLYSKARNPSQEINTSRPESEQTGLRYQEVQGPIRYPRVLLGFHTAPITSEDYPALELLRAMLALGDGSILSRRLRDQKKVILQGSVDHPAFSDVGYLRLQMQVEPENIDRCEIAVFTELEILKRQEPDKADLQRASAQLEREYWERWETVQGRVKTLAQFEAYAGWISMSDYLLRLRKVEASDVSRVAGKYLRLENCSVVEFLPVGSEARRATADTVQKSLHDLLEVSVQEELAARERATVRAVKIPEESGTFNYREVRYPMQKASVLRGPELFIREDHTSPLIQLGLFFPGGKLFEKKENSGITSLMLRSMLRGTKETDADQLFRQLGVYGAKVSPVVEDDYFGFLFSVLSKNIEQGLDFLLEIVKSPKFEAEEISRERNYQLARLREGRESDPGSPHSLLLQGLFGNHPYALRPLGTEESLAALTAESVRAWYKSSVENRKPVVVIIGDTEGTSLAHYFVHNFSGSRFQDVQVPDDFPKPVERRVLITEALSSSESVIMLGFQAPPEGDEDFYSLKVLERYATGTGGRLLEELRDRQGLVLEGSLTYEPRLRGGSLTIFLTSAPEREEKALGELEQEIRRLAETPTSYKEYRSVINTSVGKYWIDQQSRLYQIASMVRHFLSGRGVEELSDYPARLQSVREEDLQEVARKVLRLEKSVTVRLHGKSFQ